jgi:hypothetical protein
MADGEAVRVETEEQSMLFINSKGYKADRIFLLILDPVQTGSPREILFR